MYQSSLQQAAQLEVVNETQASLDVVREDVVQGQAASASLSSGVTDTYGPPPTGGTWAGNDNTLIMAMPSLTASRNDSARTFVRTNTYGCGTTTLLTNPIHRYNFVYFVHEGTLYRRTLVNTGSPSLCGTPVEAATCPVYQTTSGCTKDRVIATGVTGFTVRYEVPTTGEFPNTACPSGSTTSPTATEEGLNLCTVTAGANSAKVVTVLLTVSREVNGVPFTYTSRFSVRPLSGGGSL